MCRLVLERLNAPVCAVDQSIRKPHEVKEDEGNRAVTWEDSRHGEQTL